MATTLIAHDDLSPSATPNTNILAWTPTPLNGFASAWLNSRLAFAGGFTVIINYGAKFNSGTPRSTPLVKIDSGLHENYEISCDMYYADSQPWRMGFWIGLPNIPSDPASNEGSSWMCMQTDVSSEHVLLNKLRSGGGVIGGGVSDIGLRYTDHAVGSGWGYRWGFTSRGPAATAETEYWWEPFGGGTRTVIGTVLASTSGYTPQDAGHRCIGLHYENNACRFQNVMVYAIDPLGEGCDDPITPTIFTGDGDTSILPIFTFDPAWLAK